MTNVTKLRESLTDVYEKVLSGEMKLDTAAQLTNCAGKIIGTVRIEMDYARMTDTKPDIEFMKNKEDKQK